MKRMFFKQKYLDYILEGKKVLEGRVGYDNIKRINIGDFVSLNGKYKAKIQAIQKYKSFKEALNENNFRLLIPDALSIEEALNIYNEIYPLWKQEKLGVIIFRIKYPI